MIELPDPNTASGLAHLDAHLSDRSFVAGDGTVGPTQADARVFSALRREPAWNCVGCANVRRWYNHVKSYPPEDRREFPSPEVMVKVKIEQQEEVEG